MGDWGEREGWAPGISDVEVQASWEHESGLAEELVWPARAIADQIGCREKLVLAGKPQAANQWPSAESQRQKYVFGIHSRTSAHKVGLPQLQFHHLELLTTSPDASQLKADP